MKIGCWILLLSLSVLNGAFAHEAQTQSSDLAASFAFDAQGKLWRVNVQHGMVQVAKSEDLKTFGNAVAVNKEPQDIKPMGEERPQIAIGTQGEIYVVWVQHLKPHFASYIWFARSIDGGKSFENPYIVHQNRAEIGHAFARLQVAANGELTVVWLDARDLVVAKKMGKGHAGSSIYYAVSLTQGNTFQSEQKLVDSSCECCRIATAVNPQNSVVALWRHVFAGGERDHAIAEIPQKNGQEVALKRASYGHWKIDGCPHHGAAIAAGGEGKDWWGYHLAYFDGNEQKSGLYYSRVDGEAWAFSPPKKFGRIEKQAGHPALLSIGEKVWLVWYEFEKNNSQIWGQFSDDGGRNWDEATLLATAEDKADYPQLLHSENAAFLVWNTQKNGLLIQQLTNN